ncbi:hypothetical protein AB0M47_03555 [Hamadaea sp. NPDC051192]|uniref:hypothetical protein n=1 Tax=Hamadaea sp. NPDC051192 TaxID=3154940 RepID=UPI00344848E2
MSTSQVRRAADFIWLTGRVLDQRRLEHFLSGSEGVEAALAAYETADGAYAYGLEPDIKGPQPQPLTVMTALRLLDEIDALDQKRAEPMIRWLGGHVTADGGLPALLPTMRDFPHPPWIEPPTEPQGGLLPTARIAGLLFKHGVTVPWLAAATEFCWAGLDAMTTTHPYEVHCCVVFLDHVPDRVRATKAADRLGELVREQELFQGQRVVPGYAETEFHYAYDFAPTPESMAARWFTDAEMSSSLDRLVADQQPDGGWQISWRRWAPTTESEARPGVTIERLHTLRAWNRLP